MGEAADVMRRKIAAFDAYDAKETLAVFTSDTEKEVPGASLHGGLQMSEQIVVVGVDGSPASYTALRWALWHVGCTGGQLRAVRCFRPVAVPRWEAAVTGEPVRASAEQQVQAQRELDQVVAAAMLRVTNEVALRRRVVRGLPGPALVAEARGASLLVVGSHDHRPLRRFTHGSVSAYCIQHASCPVLVIPPATGIRGMSRMHSVSRRGGYALVEKR